ncbi:hypothetical protein ZWY2020_033116 [Hordeum vulgare]|nr:hypothetical protein ZWY2020_033116 [Hordeum vulgare]
MIQSDPNTAHAAPPNLAHVRLGDISSFLFSKRWRTCRCDLNQHDVVVVVVEAEFQNVCLLLKDPFVVNGLSDGGEIQEALSDMVGRRTVPQVFIHGKHLGGSDDSVDAYESGELAKLLNISVKDDL